MKPTGNCQRSSRRGAIIFLTALLTVVMLGMIAFAVDLGYVVLVRSQLQVTADSAALAGAGSMYLGMPEMISTAQSFAASNHVAGKAAAIAESDIETGMWDIAERRFTPTATMGNAVRVTVKTGSSGNGATPLFFAKIFGLTSVTQQASAVATTNPRDIAFVVDLSGSMNDDTDPSNTASLNNKYKKEGYPTIGSDLLNLFYEDMGYPVTDGSEPSQKIGKPLGVQTLGQLSDPAGPLSKQTIAEQYRISKTDDLNTRTKKAYSWAMDVQVPQAMPLAKPTPNSGTNYDYWYAYLKDNNTSIGYRSYVHFMLYYGRNAKPGSNTYTPLSKFSPYCSYHTESTVAGPFDFPPREQPTHAARRSMIAAINVIKERNQNISNPYQQDWVSIITFDLLSEGGPVVAQPLTNNYIQAMQQCTSLQACGGPGAHTATEAGLRAARNHIKSSSEGGAGRINCDKIVVLLTDGMPNLYDSSAYVDPSISGYISEHPNKDFYGSDNYRNSSLMQTSMMQNKFWHLFPVGIGLGCDYDFMDRMARMGKTASKDGESPRGSGNPAEYEQRLMEIFDAIISNPKLRLVQ